MGIFKKAKEVVNDAADKVKNFVEENKPELKDVGIMLGAVAIGSFLAGGAIVLGMKAADAATAKWNAPNFNPVSTATGIDSSISYIQTPRPTDNVRVSISAPASFLANMPGWSNNVPMPPTGGV